MLVVNVATMHQVFDMVIVDMNRGWVPLDK